MGHGIVAGMTTEILAPIEGPSAWYGPDMVTHADQWLYELDAAEIAEINDAVAALVTNGTPLLEVSRDNFPLPDRPRLLVPLR